MTDETHSRKHWETIQNYGAIPRIQSNVSTPVSDDYTRLRDACENVLKLNRFNVENQNHELFNQSSNSNLTYSTSVQPNSNYNIQREFNEKNRNNNAISQNEDSESSENFLNASSMYSSNPILELVGKWTPGTSIYGNCFKINNCDLNENHANQRQYNEQNKATTNDPINIGSITQVKKKQRIVAEVKPMRMSYSDVLSKNVLPREESENTKLDNNFTSNNISHACTKKKISRLSVPFEKKTPISIVYDEKPRKSQNVIINTEKVNSKHLNGRKSCSFTEKNTKEKRKTNNNNCMDSKIKSKYKKSDKHKKIPSLFETSPNVEHIDYEDFHISDEINQNEYIQTTSYDKASKCHKKNKIAPRSSSKQDKFNLKRTQKNHKSQKNRSEMLEKLYFTWIEYTTKFGLWLWSLIIDVVFMSFGIVWDKVLNLYNHIKKINKTMCIGNRPTKWLKTFWIKLHVKFRRFTFRSNTLGKKQKENLIDHYRDGKLPTNAEEAMYSLLNCKEKDAYSILGVTQDCPQERIRKHFHKIALLVHPDKNKQIGSEEAFKVLQRSFELIGEPESRKQYDLSLAEALNAEKAWSELNDLLKQLHTKISEAANTIRCSSCYSRHPRKPTGRPHYAARECNSCRIRHSAREGDIWAETTFLGLRWKYLALMEGKVFDITEWANCSGQKGALSHLQPNSHIVQYRIILNSQQQQQQQQVQHEKEKINKKEQFASEPTFDDILANVYGGQKKGPVTRRKHKK
ncbi:dnaJ homolog dnj-5 [Culicoides brevitarsis]|uniref:dnaJ homolog dnj-5 n=1 Tax=Culicoides brevitarsis TaxID=469753 RepID=UPI00307B7B4E